MLRIFASFAFFLLFSFNSICQACSVCGCGDPLASAGSAHPLANSWRLDIQSIYLTASAQSDDGSGDVESVRQVNLNTTLSYSPTSDLTLTVMLPLVEKYWYLTPSATSGDSPDAGTPFGLGDILVGFRYFFWQETNLRTQEHQALAVSAGAYLPTGGTNFTSLITGNNLDTHAQLGTGAFGFYGGLLYNKVWDGFTLTANGNAVIRTTAYTSDPNSPVYKYTFGSSFTGGVQGQLKVVDPLAVSLAVEGRYAMDDTELNGVANDGSIWDTPNTGGTVVDLTPGLWWNLADNSTLYAKVQIPVYTRLNGVQEVDPTYTVGTQFLIQ
jgi:hypothetical protein